MNRVESLLGEIKCGTRLLLHRKRYRLELRILKNVIACNMGAVYRDSGPNALKHIARKNMRHHEITAAFLEYWPHKTRSQEIAWSGYEIFENTMNKGGGAVFCSIHFGNYYLFPFEIARRGYETVIVVGDQHRQYETILNIKSSLNLPVEVVKTDGGALMKLLSELKRGKAVYILLDEIGGTASSEKLLCVAFLGRILRFKRGAGALRYYSGAPVIPVTAEILGNNRHLITVGQPLDDESDKPKDRDSQIDNTVLELFGKFEKLVRAHPDQWQKWIDLKRYETRSRRVCGSEQSPDLKNARLVMSKKRMRMFRDHKGYMLVDMREGRYFALDNVGRYVVRMMYRRRRYEQIAARIRKKFRLSEKDSTDRIRKIASIGTELD